jgi:TrmH family RNA methyltransferase
VRAPVVKAAKRLLKRAYRAQDRAFIAEGVQAVREALDDVAGRGGRPGPAVRQLFVTAPARDRNPELIERAGELGIAVQLASGQVLAELSETVTPQGLAAVCELRDVTLDVALGGAPALVVVLASVRDPGNAGTVLRTADAAGADGVIFTDNSVDPYNGKCVRASAGSLFHLPVVAGVPVEQAIEALRARGLQILAADGSATVDLDELERSGGLAAPTGWIFGNEAWGLPRPIVEAADRAVAVPIHGRAESLNLAAAAAVCLYASARSRRGLS